MKTIVLYKSKYGHAKTYAEMIASRLEAKSYDIKDWKKAEIQKADLIIFGSGVYIGKINHIQKALRLFSDQQLVIFACGGELEDETTLARLKETNLTEPKYQDLPFFYLPGGMDLSKVKGLMKLMLSMIQSMLAKKTNRTEEEERFYQQFHQASYYVDARYIEPLVAFCQNTKKLP